MDFLKNWIAGKEEMYVKFLDSHRKLDAFTLVMTQHEQPLIKLVSDAYQLGTNCQPFIPLLKVKKIARINR